MNATTTEPTNESAGNGNAALRRSVYALLIAIGIGVVLGRIFAVDKLDEALLFETQIRGFPKMIEAERTRLEAAGAQPDRIEQELKRKGDIWRLRIGARRPFLSANDRSRWCTFRALVESDMWVATEFPGADGQTERRWVPYAINNVVGQPGWETIDMVKHSVPSHGENGVEFLYSSKPPLLPTLMAVPYWVLHKATGKTLGTHPYAIGRTLLVIYNVIPLLIYFVLITRLVERFGTSDWGRIFVVAVAVFGTFLTTFSVTVNNHLPGAVCALVAMYAGVRIWFDGERRLRYFFTAGLFATFVVACELPGLAFTGVLGAALLWKAPKQTLLAGAPAALLVAVGFFGTNWVAHESLKPAYMHTEWYDYEYQRMPNGETKDSHWRSRPGIDKGEPSEMTYAFHALVGHHGILSLTPVWILAAVGLGMWLLQPSDPRLRQMAILVAVVTAVCLYFYLFMQPQGNRNYGGMTAGLRWSFWFIPMWLVTMLPAADRCAQKKWLRGTALVLLAISALSASYPTWNPWTHPWLWNLLSYLTGPVA